MIAAAPNPLLAQPAKTNKPADDVVRTNIDLVQTAITVVDKNGKFVEGLDRADFELLIDGKPRRINFLERITAGSDRETQLSLRKPPENSTPAPAPTNATVRDGTVVLTCSLRKLDKTFADPDRIPYAADLPLQSLTPGSYELRVKITDAVAGTSAAQITDFVVL